MDEQTRDERARPALRVDAHLTQTELAERWKLSPRTLEKWRQTRVGPRYLRLGGRVAYRLDDVLAFEASCLRGDG